MNYQIRNDKLEVSVMARGAQMCSVQDACKKEYLWQPDEQIWADQAPTLFPYVGRLHNQTYTYKKKEYTMGIHGFAMDYEFVCQNIRDDYLVCVIENTEETRKIYPFSFQFEVHYELIDSTIRVKYVIKNKDNKAMYFGVGGHPGFKVPLGEGERFEDYYLHFPKAQSSQQIWMTDTGYVLEGKDHFALKEGNILPLRHQLFDQDAIVLTETGQEVELCGPAGTVLTVRYPDMPYLGLWHRPKTEAEYVCIEPWSSLPARYETIEALEEKQDLICLEAGEVYCNTWEIIL